MPKITLARIVGLLLLLCPFGLRAQTVTTFEGIDASQLAKPQFDFDPNGSVGTKQYMQWVDPYYQAWSKTSPYTSVWSKPQNGDTPFVNAGLTQCSTIQGDGIVTFDRLASRWIIAAHNQLSSTVTAYYYCVAVSSTDDLTSPSLTWYTYAFNLDSVLGTNPQGNLYFPDWPKFGTWIDAYYVGMDVQDTNDGFLEVGVVACALDRADMLIGATALTPQCFKVPGTTTDTLDLEHSLEPADVEGTTPPATGTPEYFVSIQNPLNNGVATTSDSFNLWTFSVDWSNPANTTFTQASVSSPVYTPGCYQAKASGNTVCVPEPSTGTTNNYIDSVGDRFMYRFSYRNFGGYESYLISHTVQVGTAALSQTGIRWYEMRGSSPPTPYQSGTVSPDTVNYRMMPSITQDQSGNAAVGYSISSSTMHPSIAASYWNLNGDTTPTEISLYAGTADQENTYKWGDYTDMTVDPENGCTFWYNNEYFTQNQTGTGKPIWQTRVAYFTLPSCGGVTATPTSLNFGSQAVGTTSAAQQVILNNGTSTALTIDSIFGNGADPGDFNQTNNCGSSVGAGSSCTLNVTFTPKATGSRTSTLNISDSASNSPQTVSLSGTGTNGGTLSFSATSVNFGNQADGTTSLPAGVTVTNTGNSTVTFTSIQVTGTNAANFGESDNCLPTLAQGNSCTINVTFSPSTTGSYSAAVTLTDNAQNSPQSIGLSGTGIAPVTLSASSISFGTVQIGNSKTASPVTLTNHMNVALTGITVVASGSGFSQTNTCGSSIAAGATCTITATFTPTVAGAASGSITITDSANNSPQSITLTGTGQAPVGVNPLNLAFGSVTVGTTTAAKTVTITNNLKVALTITSIGFNGPDPNDYAQTNTCGSSLAAAAKCTISVTFTPEATGTRAANLVITDSAVTSPQKVKLSGVGTN
jgi:hypothetical protein